MYIQFARIFPRMKVLKYLTIIIGLSIVTLCNNPAKALTSFYDRSSQRLVVEGVNLDQDFTLTESDLQEIINDVANNTIGDSPAFFIRFFFSPSVESQIVQQIEANQDQNGASPSLVIVKNNDLRDYRTRVKVARVERAKKSFGFLNFINPDSIVKTDETKFSFDLHDFSRVEKDETVGFEFSISTAKSFSGNIDFRVSLNKINTGSDSGGSSVDNGSGGSGSGGSGSGGSGADVANPSINSDIDDALENITDKLGDSFDVVNQTAVCGNANAANEVDVCDSGALRDLLDDLNAARSDLNSLKSDNVDLKNIINTARKDKLLTKKEANRIKDALNNKRIDKARKDLNTAIKDIQKKLNKGNTFQNPKALARLQKELDQARNKLTQAHSDLRNDVLRPLLDKNIISQEVFDKYNVDIEDLSSGGSDGGSSSGAGTTTTTTSTTNPDGSVVVTNPDGSTTTTLPDGTTITDKTNADGSITPAAY